MRWTRQRLELLASDEPYSFVGGPFGSKLTSRDYVDDGIPVIRGSNLNNGRYLGMDDFVFVSESKVRKDLSGNLAKAHDLIFTQRGTLGQVALIPRDGISELYVVSQSQMKLTVDKSKADRLFLYYYFSSRDAVERIMSFTSSSGVPHINLAVLRSLEVPVPPLTTQRAVADVLSAYDDLIENNQRRMALLEESARLLYQEWFVRLRFPGHEHTRIIDGVPVGWEKKTLGELATILMGQSPESKYYNEVGDGLPFHQGVTDFGDRFVSNRVYCSLERRIAEPGDILCSVRAPVGRLNSTLDKIVIGRGLAALRSRTDNQSFLFQQLRTHFFKDDIVGSGAIFASVTRKDFEAQELLTPTPTLVGAFEQVSLPIDQQLRVLFLSNQNLRTARDLLLPRLMSGEIAV